MKHSCFSFFKLTLALLLLLQVGKGSAQTIPATNTQVAGNTYYPTAWTQLTPNTDTSDRYFWSGDSNYPWSGSVSNPPNGHTVWISGLGSEISGTVISGLTVGKNYKLTFYMAELQSPNIPSIGFFSPSYDGILEVGKYTNSAASFSSLATYPFTGGASTAWSQKTLSFTATATTFKIAFKYANGDFINGNFWNLSIASNAVVEVCNAGTTAPVPNPTTKATVCPATTVSLTSLVEPPTGGVLTVKWFTNNTATGTAVADATQAPAGTYYAFYYDATNTCYSPASTAVTVTETDCCPTQKPNLN